MNLLREPFHFRERIMQVVGLKSSYNTHGASAIYSYIGFLLTVKLGDYGDAVEEINVRGCLPSATRTPLPTLETDFDQFHQHLDSLPRVTFQRNLKRVKIEFLSEHFSAEDDEGWNPSVEKCRLAAGEVAAAVPLIRTLIEPTDSFDRERFLSDVAEILTTNIDTVEEWEQIRQQAKEKLLAIQATKKPWGSLIHDLSTSPGTFWCLHLPQIAASEREPLKQEVLAYLLNCCNSRGQTVAVARMAEPHGGLRSLFRVETCADWLRKEVGMSAQQAHDSIAHIKSFDVRVADRLNQIAANPRWMLGYAAASFQQPDVLVYGTDGMDPMGIKAAHRYMEVVAENRCVIHMSPRFTGPHCPTAAKCVEIGGNGGC